MAWNKRDVIPQGEKFATNTGNQVFVIAHWKVGPTN